MENEKCLIVHEYKIRVNNEYFMCLLVGNKEKAEYFLFNEWQAKEVYFIKSFAWNKSVILKMASRNRKFDGGMLVRLSYLHQWNGYTDCNAPNGEKADKVSETFYAAAYHKKDKMSHIEDGYIYLDDKYNGGDDLEDDYEE